MPTLIEVLGLVGRISDAAALEAIEAVLYTEMVGGADESAALLALLRDLEVVFSNDHARVNAIQAALWRLTTRY